MTAAPQDAQAPPVTVVLTWLYVPGDRPEVVAKALCCGADVVLVDLEDAVSPGRKDYALRATAELLSDAAPGPVPVHVRVNALDGPRAETEIRTLAGLPGLAGLRLPKVQGPADVLRALDWATTPPPAAPVPYAPGASTRRTARRTLVGPLPTGPTTTGRTTATLAPAPPGRPSPSGPARAPALHALLESALGVEHAFAIATAHPAVRGIALGEADLAAELRLRDETGLTWARGRTVNAAHAAGLAPPPQSVYRDIRDLEGLARSCAQGRALGFLGRAAIHPRQLPVIESAHLPGPEEIEAAEEIVRAAATDAGALALPDGRFVDAAVVAGARQVLALAGRRR
ncbi:HpcH/HpaI aldolase/citrate lyase family protein [Streptomyces sp. NPDC048248]|uniref:HpcH/HpaI aldolase/citrate lyase family protein n=1 Tax=Streptomyces sp. NPDC048248 TaxID=3365523 RepID=UPI003723B4A5